MTGAYYDDGQCVIYHGDCREVLPTLDLTCIGVVLADPPYGETSLEWDRWPAGWVDAVAAAVPEHVSMWCFGSMRMFLARAEDFDAWRLAQDVVWEKHNGSGFASDRFKRVHENVLQWYRGRWEAVYKAPVTTLDATARTVKRRGQTPHTGEIGSTCDYETHDGGPRLERSVIRRRSCNGYAIHPTQKPVGILQPLLAYSLPRGGLVLDPFMGSGSTLIAARDHGSRAIGIEVNEADCERAASRLDQGVLAI